MPLYGQLENGGDATGCGRRVLHERCSPSADATGQPFRAMATSGQRRGDAGRPAPGFSPGFGSLVPSTAGCSPDPAISPLIVSLPYSIAKIISLP